MGRTNGMQLIQGARQAGKRNKDTESQGLGVWILDFLRSYCSFNQVQEKHRLLQLVETLSLGGKKQLTLVSCGGAYFLVGGTENVETIVRVGDEVSLKAVAKDLDKTCE